MTGRYYVGMDGSRPSEVALEWALARAAARSLPLTLVYVADEEFGLAGHEFAEAQERHGAKLLSSAAAHAKEDNPTVEIDTLLRRGNLAWELNSVADADSTVVVGTNKTGFIHGRILGSRSVQVAAAADCSVAVIPDIDLTYRTGIVAGLPSEDAAAPIARAAANEASLIQQPLLLVHALAAPPGSHPAAHAYAERVLDLATAEVQAFAPGLQVEARATERPAADALLNLAGDKTLLVLGSPRRAEERHSPIGSVLHQVLVNINVPVLVVALRRDAV